MGNPETQASVWASSQPGPSPQLFGTQAKPPASQNPNGVALNTNEETKSQGNTDDDFIASDEDEDSNVNMNKKWVLNRQPKPRKTSQKRRADTAAFELWIEQNQTALCKRARKSVVQDAYSAQALVQDFESKKIIASPREYQLELFERAKTQNTIAVLDTGSGKTLIAALLLRWTLDEELKSRASQSRKRIAFFVVDKVALVFQQHAVLSCNLDYPIEKMCGEMVVGLQSKKEFWDKVFDENMAIVCTADILYSCLSHSWISMEQINLLVFDEAHHTKGNHPYARIIKDFYAEVKDPEKKPRILGMTASPVDAKVSPANAALALEGLLHSQIATVSDPSLLQQTVCKPKRESVVEYGATPRSPTKLDLALRKVVGDHALFRGAFAFTASASQDMGGWCVDRFWKLFFEQEDAVAIEAKTMRNARREGKDPDSYLLQVKEARQLVVSHVLPSAVEDLGRFSPKVIQLIRVLWDQYRDADGKRKCVVFVQQRNTATALADLLKQPGIMIPETRIGVLTGGGNSSYENHRVSFRDQVLTILKFRRGELNCLFATSVAEEGMDIPDCNVIIRFDLYNTLIQYIQSRGRARQAGSEYIHMVEKLNPVHQQKVMETKTHEDALRKFCEMLPDDRKLAGNDYDMEYFLRKDKGQKRYVVPETGAKLNFRRSLVCLAAFVASLPHPPETSLTAEYVVTAVAGGFKCEVMLPSASPIPGVTGDVYPSKATAKCSAAFEMCMKLIEGKYLDEHLHPVFTKQRPSMGNARIGVNSRQKEEYNMRIKPEIWSSLGQPTRLYAMVLSLAQPGKLGRSSLPLLLLTRHPIPRITSFPLFFGPRRSSEACCTPVPGWIEMDDQKLNLLALFTLRIYNDVFSKTYSATAAQLPYFLAPTMEDHDFDFSRSIVENLLNWEVMRFVQENEVIKYDPGTTDEFFQGKFIIDQWDGSRKFISLERRHDVRPTDQVPDGVVAPRHRAWIKSCEDHSIYNYSISLWSNSRAKMTFSKDQPVVEAELLSIRRNLLDENSADDDLGPKRCFLILEPMRISALPVEVVAMAYNFPAMIHRIDSNLIALDACRLLGLEHIRSDLALEAFTKDGDNADEGDVEEINFQGGMGNNYERLEFLGDCFLKMATTISIFTLIPDKGEHEYHVERMLLLCNQNLFNNALKVKLEEYVRSMAFNRRTWYPEGLNLVKGKRVDTSKWRHRLADKSIADVCEAIIGAAYLTTRERNNFDMAIQAVTALVKDKNHTMATYSDYYAAYKKPDWQTEPATVVQKHMAERLHQRIGYRFKYPRLLRSAFQHPTYPTSYEGLPSYQRLEFLGDALFDMACIDYLFHRFPGADPQWLTEHKMAMVTNQFLGCLGFSLGFHRSILSHSAAVQKELADYVVEMEDALQAAKDEAVKAGGTETDFRRNFWLNCSRPPKSLPDVVEAYIGAMFVDSEYDYSTVQSFFENHVKPWFEDMRLYDTFANKHPTTFLGRLMQGKFQCRDWRVLVRESGLAANGDDTVSSLGAAATRIRMEQLVGGVLVHGGVIASSMSTSARYAKQAVSKKAIALLEHMNVGEFKEKYGCSCTKKEEDVVMAVDPKADSMEAHGPAI